MVIKGVQGQNGSGAPKPDMKKPPASRGSSVERVTRIELALSAWEADVLPLNYTRRRVQYASSPPVARRPGGVEKVYRLADMTFLREGSDHATVLPSKEIVGPMANFANRVGLRNCPLTRTEARSLERLSFGVHAMARFVGAIHGLKGSPSLTGSPHQLLPPRHRWIRKRSSRPARRAP
jgi:hypothetical protein